MSWETLVSIEPFSWISIATALLCGTVVGFERQMRDKPVGIRTSALIVLGTYVFITSAGLVTTEASDPSRIIGQVVTGIGFLGAGVMLTKEGVVVGVTSAATIWSLAAIGVVIAVIDSIVAIKMSFIIVIILWGVSVFEEQSSRITNKVHKRYRGWRARK